MIQNWFFASVGLIAGLVILITFLPLFNVLSPLVVAATSSSIGMFVSVMVLIIVVGVIYQFISTATREETYY